MDTVPKVRSSRPSPRDMQPIRYLGPDVRSPEFLAEARRQCLAVNASPHAEEDQAFIDAISAWPDEYHSVVGNADCSPRGR